MSLFFIFLAFVMILLGGLLGLRLKEQSHRLLAVSAGIILGIVSFELLPEAIENAEHIGSGSTVAMVGFVIGFLLIHILERTILLHHAHEDEYAHHSHPHVGKAQALAIISHTFVDGLMIGLSFGVSQGVGIGVSVAILAHDFCDGLNTVSLMMRHGNSKSSTVKFLVANAIAPLVGGLIGLMVEVPQGSLPYLFGGFSGVLLYIAAADVLPEAHAKHSGWKTFALTLGGVIIAYGITQFVGHHH